MSTHLSFFALSLLCITVSTACSESSLPPKDPAAVEDCKVLMHQNIAIGFDRKTGSTTINGSPVRSQARRISEELKDERNITALRNEKAPFKEKIPDRRSPATRLRSLELQTALILRDVQPNAQPRDDGSASSH